LYLHPFPPSFGPPPFLATIQRMRPMGFDGVDGGESPAWLEALGASRPCVYVTFGTEIGNMAPVDVVAQAFADTDVDVVVTVGRGADRARSDLDPLSPTSPKPVDTFDL
jgi:UDP:flavonoid glycosyltransferase YjiC (YdhE family)